MLRWNPFVIVAVLALSLPLAARAETFNLVGGEFTFAHAPVDPENPDDVQLDPPGFIFNVPSESFDGQIVAANVRLPILKKGPNFPGLGLPFQRLHLPFVGMGEATGCVFLNPTSTTVAEFTGSFVWSTEEGELHGTFYMQDHFIGLEQMLGASIFITFTGGTERFATARGEAFALGVDLPFGGLGGDPSTAGVVAAILAGNLRLN